MRCADRPRRQSQGQGISANALDDCITRRVSGGAIAVAGNISESAELDVQWQFWDGKAWTGRTAASKQQVIVMRVGGVLNANPHQWQAEANAMLKSSARKSAKPDQFVSLRRGQIKQNQAKPDEVIIHLSFA